MSIKAANKVAEILGNTGMSQVELAKELGVSTQTVWRWVHGKKPGRHAERKLQRFIERELAADAYGALVDSKDPARMILSAIARLETKLAEILAELRAQRQESAGGRALAEDVRATLEAERELRSEEEPPED